MGVYIKGIEMPRNCGICGFKDGCEFSVPLTERPFDCPLIEVPPHGRLGDLDELEQMFVDIDNAPYSGFDGEEPFYSAEDAAQIIRLTPTVIPADKDGET